jgi:hypothetical protein
MSLFTIYPSTRTYTSFYQGGFITQDPVHTIDTPLVSTSSGAFFLIGTMFASRKSRSPRNKGDKKVDDEGSRRQFIIEDMPSLCLSEGNGSTISSVTGPRACDASFESAELSTEMSEASKLIMVRSRCITHSSCSAPAVVSEQEGLTHPFVCIVPFAPKK